MYSPKKKKTNKVGPNNVNLNISNMLPKFRVHGVSVQWVFTRRCVTTSINCSKFEMSI